MPISPPSADHVGAEPAPESVTTRTAEPAISSLLLLLLDSRSPAGAHSHSAGMEAAVHAGYVNTPADVADFCRGRLETAGRVNAAFSAASCRGWQQQWAAGAWAELDAEFSARNPSEATRRVSRALGSGLRRLVKATVPHSVDRIALSWHSCPAPAPHHPLVLGAAVAIGGGTPELAARAAALFTCTAPASAAVRLLGLDPYAVHLATAQLTERIDLLAAVHSRNLPPDELPCTASPALDLLADVHAQMEVRLFAS